jgi:hypothetical protein
VIAALPEGERGTYEDGLIPVGFAGLEGPDGRYAGQRERVTVVTCETLSLGGFARRRSSGDLEYIASLHPGTGRAIARWLEVTAERADHDLAYDSPEGPCCAKPAACGGHDAGWFCGPCGRALGNGCGCGWGEALAVARQILQGAGR